MQKQWIACAAVCLGVAIACSAQRGSSASDEAKERAVSSRREAALAARGVTAEVLLDEPTSLPLWPDAVGPLSLSADPNGFLVTWFDNREGKGVDSFAGAQPHVVATHVSNSGAVSNPADLILSKGLLVGTGNVYSAFNGEFYLVVWHKLAMAAPYASGIDLSRPTEIDAVRVSTSGEVMDANPFVLGTLPAGDVSTIDAVLSDGSGFFVAWSGSNETTGPGPEQSRTLSFSGSSLTLGAITTYPFSGGNLSRFGFAALEHGYAAAAVSADNSGFTVGALSHAASSDCAAGGATINAIALGSNGAGELLVAYTGRVVTSGILCTVGTKVVQIGVDGLQKAPPILLGSMSAPPTVAYFNGKYLVPGFQIDPSSNVASTAVSVPSPFACNASTCLASVGTAVSRLSSAGALRDDPPITVRSPAREESAARVVAGAGEYLALWREQTGDPPKNVTRAGRLSAAGVPLDPQPLLIATQAFVLDVGFDGTDFVVLWFVQQPSNAYSLRFTRISPSGVVKDPTGIELDGSVGGAVMACTASECLVVWSNATTLVYPPPPQVTYATRVANGKLLDSPPFEIVPTVIPIALESTGSGYLMQCVSDEGIKFQLLDPTGHPTGEPLPGGEQRLAHCGSGYLASRSVVLNGGFVWSTALLDSSATVLQAELDLGGVPAWESTSTSTPSGCVIAWPQISGDSWDIYANRLNSDGTGLRPQALPIATDVFNEYAPALTVGADGKIMAVYSHFIAQAPYGNFRIAARLIDPAAFAQSGTAGDGGEPGTSTGTSGSPSTGGSANTAGSPGSSTGDAGEGGGDGGAPADDGGASSAGAAHGGASQGHAGASAAGASAAGASAAGANAAGANAAGANHSAGAGAPGGHGPGAGGCAMTPHGAPDRSPLAFALALLALSGWRRSRPGAPRRRSARKRFRWRD